MAHVFQDNANGRYLVHHRMIPGSRKSFIRNKRDVEFAVAKALVQLWAWEQQISGVEPPLPQELVGLASSV